MADSSFTPSIGGRYVFLPEMPTPNGRLHLGHMSGPYLRADIVARFLRSRGAEAYIVSGSDVYESHVELKASQTGRSIPDVCNGFHRDIRAELGALGIECDLYLNPLDPEIGPAYVDFNSRALDELRRLGRTEERDERVRFSASAHRYLTGCWLSGRCPQCHAKAGSFLCEECGTQYDPQDVEDVVLPPTLSDVGEVTVRSLFLRVSMRDRLWAQIARMGIEPGFVRIVEQYFARNGHLTRLTNAGTWGMPYGEQGQVIYTYTALFAFSVFCGQVLAERRGWQGNPFDHESGFTTIGGFGIDNAIPYLVGALASAIEWGRYRPFDFYQTNHFYLLEGKKFSTSRQHLVAARDLVETAGADADAVRYFLAKVNPERAKRSFEPAEFVRCHNDDLHRDLGGRIQAAFATASQGPAITPIPEAIAGRLKELCRAQECDLMFPNPCLERAVSTIDVWSLYGAALGFSTAPAQPAAALASEAYWWLKGLALLAQPFMPSIAGQIWARLGASGVPSPTTFTTPTQPPGRDLDWVPFRKVDPSSIEKSISRQK